MNFAAQARRLAALAPAALGTASAAAADAAPGAAGMLQMLPGLVFVLALILGMAWLARRFGVNRGAAAGPLRVVSQCGVGARERVVVVEVADQWLVLGVAPGAVRQLTQMARPQGAAAPPAGGDAVEKPPFAAWLERALGKSQ
jgi:flagellar protein FliO/FliZ